MFGTTWNVNSVRISLLENCLILSDSSALSRWRLRFCQNMFLGLISDEILLFTSDCRILLLSLLLLMKMLLCNRRYYKNLMLTMVFLVSWVMASWILVFFADFKNFHDCWTRVVWVIFTASVLRSAHICWLRASHWHTWLSIEILGLVLLLGHLVIQSWPHTVQRIVAWLRGRSLLSLLVNHIICCLFWLYQI